MKLWLVIYTALGVGGSAGPLPYGMEECERRAEEFRSAQKQVVDTGYSEETKRVLTIKEIADIKSMRFECEYRTERPTLDTIEQRYTAPTEDEDEDEDDDHAPHNPER